MSIDLQIPLGPLAAQKSPSSFDRTGGAREAAGSDRPRGRKLTITARIDNHY